MLDAGVRLVIDGVAPATSVTSLYNELMAAMVAVRPLEETDKLAIRLQNRENDREAFRKLSHACAPLSRRLFNSHFPGFERDDMQQTIHIAMIRAVRSYDPSRASFLTHFQYRLADERKRLRLSVHPRGQSAARDAAPAYLGTHDTVTDTISEYLPNDNDDDWMQFAVSGHCAEEAADRAVKRRIIAEFLTDYELAPRRQRLFGRRNRLIAEAVLFHERGIAETSYVASINRERGRQIMQDVIHQFVGWCRANHPALEAGARTLPAVLDVTPPTAASKIGKTPPPRSGQVICLHDTWDTIQVELARIGAAVATDDATRRAQLTPVPRAVRMLAHRGSSRATTATAAYA